MAPIWGRLGSWQKRGVGLFWERYETQPAPPGTSEPMMVTGQQTKVDWNCP